MRTLLNGALEIGGVALDRHLVKILIGTLADYMRKKLAGLYKTDRIGYMHMDQTQ